MNCGKTRTRCVRNQLSLGIEISLPMNFLYCSWLWEHKRWRLLQYFIWLFILLMLYLLFKTWAMYSSLQNDCLHLFHLYKLTNERKQLSARSLPVVCPSYSPKKSSFFWSALNWAAWNWTENKTKTYQFYSEFNWDTDLYEVH